VLYLDYLFTAQVRLNGRDVEDPGITVDNVATVLSEPQHLAINFHPSHLSETWAIAELMVWNRFLTREEILEAEQYLLRTLGWEAPPERPLSLSFGSAQRTKLDMAPVVPLHGRKGSPRAAEHDRT
jgi:hypothetical protein